jgi:hypothetical protein
MRRGAVGSAALLDAVRARRAAAAAGYLWIEFALNDAYTSFGCGIRANRSTDRVTTGWFITSRRPGVDLHLVEGRVPLTADQLRPALEPGAVFGHDQRAVYRDELRRRLFGGAAAPRELRSRTTSSQRLATH